LIRSQTLYPIELWAHTNIHFIYSFNKLYSIYQKSLQNSMHDTILSQ